MKKCNFFKENGSWGWQLAGRSHFKIKRHFFLIEKVQNIVRCGKGCVFVMRVVHTHKHTLFGLIPAYIHAWG